MKTIFVNNNGWVCNIKNSLEFFGIVSMMLHFHFQSKLIVAVVDFFVGAHMSFSTRLNDKKC